MNEQVNERQLEILKQQVNQYKNEIEQVHKKNDEYLRIMDNLIKIINNKLISDEDKDKKADTGYDDFVKKEDLVWVQDSLAKMQKEISELKAEIKRSKEETSPKQLVESLELKNDFSSFRDYNTIRQALGNQSPKMVKITPHYTRPIGSSKQAGQVQKQEINKEKQKVVQPKIENQPKNENQAKNENQLKEGSFFSFLRRKS
ncbi:MAG: hypothetical protein WAP98_05255 [Caldicoprobacterales bacterium]|nr:hypothetical protein [Bacillota bacterium]NLH58712.1 hypothetical protein [Clostridiales bacterium]